MGQVTDMFRLAIYFAFSKATLHMCHDDRYYRPTFSSGGSERAVLS